MKNTEILFTHQYGGENMSRISIKNFLLAFPMHACMGYHYDINFKAVPDDKGMVMIRPDDKVSIMKEKTKIKDIKAETLVDQFNQGKFAFEPLIKGIGFRVIKVYSLPAMQPVKKGMVADVDIQLPSQLESWYKDYREYCCVFSSTKKVAVVPAVFELFNGGSPQCSITIAATEDIKELEPFCSMFILERACIITKA